MRAHLPLALALLVGLSLAACTRDERPTSTPGTVPHVFVPTQPSLASPVTAEGFLHRQDLTGYQYGTHVLLDATGRTLYALRATTLSLDNYAERPVRLTGTAVPGYPLSGGPPLLDVTDIHVASP